MARPAVLPVRREVVSFPSEQLILVDEQDHELGRLPKDRCHDGDGILHRAFSLFIFDGQGRLLLQQRSAQKRLWPLFWSNSCCSHPRHGESMDEAVHRRLQQELGISSDLRFLFKFIYQARYGDHGSEHELCWVYLGRSTDPVTPNRNEVADWRFVDVAEIDCDLNANAPAYTPWMKLEWERIRSEFGHLLPVSSA